MRFLDNFSAGTRGAASAEQFLRTGKYAVIFLHRQHSLQPFSRHYSHSTNPFLDLLEHTSEEDATEPPPESIAISEEVFIKQAELVEELPLPNLAEVASASNGESADTHIFPNLNAMALNRESPSSPPSEGRIQVRLSDNNAMQSILGSYKLVQKLGLLHTIPFVTVFDYLFLLRGIAQIMGAKETGLGRRGLYYLAAAVSDFFLPQQRMVSHRLITPITAILTVHLQSQHKIQSGKGSLVIEMDQVPKVLRTLVEHWSQDGMIVSFKVRPAYNT